MNGVVIKPPWIDLILQGKKTWEIRGTHTSTRGRIALIKSRSGRIFGTCRVVDCIGPLSLEQLRANGDKHQIPMEMLVELPYPKTYAWVLSEVNPFRDPIVYKHPSGAVIWVRLTPENVPSRYDELEEALRQPS
jgi:hypothetical protein